MTRCKACNELLQHKDDLDPIQELCNPCYDVVVPTQELCSWEDTEEREKLLDELVEMWEADYK